MLCRLRAWFPTRIPKSGYPRFWHAGPRRQTQSMASRFVRSLDPHAYTSGRWLRDDEQQRCARYIDLDFEALCQRVLNLFPGSSSISRCEKKEGGFNRVFMFTLNDERRVIARLPFALAGPPGLRTQSEVATIHYIQANTTIPVPQVLDWCDNASTAIKSEYIIMEHVQGVSLAEVWPRMDEQQRIRCVGAICQKIREIVNIDFPVYGSLYHADAPIDSVCKSPLDQKFCIGPHCGPMYWDCIPAEPRYYEESQPDRGPWVDLKEYSRALIDVGTTRVPPTYQRNQYPRYHGAPAEHYHLLDSCRDVLDSMCQDTRIQKAAAPTLLHPDLHMRNIFVSEQDPTVISGIIDWQSASIEPAFWYTQDVPDFAKHSSTPGGEGDTNAELCAQALEGSIRLLMPKLALPRMLDQTLFRPFQYSHRTWKDGAVALHQELIDTAQQWSSLNLPDSCPFVIPQRGILVSHEEHYRWFVASQNLKRDLSCLLDVTSDGWVSTDAWDRTVLAHKEFFVSMREAVLSYDEIENTELIKTENDLMEIWPFDI